VNVGRQVSQVASAVARWQRGGRGSVERATPARQQTARRRSATRAGYVRL